MERALVKQKENIVQKQVAVGREFKVCYNRDEVHEHLVLNFYITVIIVSCEHNYIHFRDKHFTVNQKSSFLRYVIHFIERY